MDTKGGKPRWSGVGGVLNWEIGIDMYTMMCIKLMIDKKIKNKNKDDLFADNISWILKGKKQSLWVGNLL